MKTIPAQEIKRHGISAAVAATFIELRPSNPNTHIRVEILLRQLDPALGSQQLEVQACKLRVFLNQ